jgi:hypothetical protein
MAETLSLGCFIAGTIWSVLRHAGISPPNPVDVRQATTQSFATDSITGKIGESIENENCVEARLD